MRFPLPLLAALVLATPVALVAQHAPAAAPKLNDANIVAIFDAANSADIQTAGLGAEKATNPRIREIAGNFVRDHTKVRQMGRDLATKLHVTPTLPAGDQGAADLAKTMKHLRSLKGAAFDKAFLDHEIAFHQAVIDAVNSTLMPAIQNDELKAFVASVAPAFAGHLAGVKHLREEVAS